MIIFPAIDILDNRAVRLLYGKRDQVTDYGMPYERAQHWVSQGAEYLHVVDLNGAFDDSKVNDKTLKELISSIGIPVQLGGGVKSLDKVKYYLEEVGVRRVILGSVCITTPEVAEKACELYGDRIVAGIDAKDNKVCIKGWVESVNETPLQVALRMKSYGCSTVVYTDIARDGALSGVNIDSTVQLQKMSGMDIIASGGMSEINEVSALAKCGVYGVILGRSIYTGAIELSSAIELGKNI